MTTRAYELREKVSEVERLYIEARYYTTVQPDVQRALDAYKVWLATYPNDYTALTNAALLHKQQGDRAEAVRKLELATKVAPDQPLGFSNLGQTYVEMAQYPEARRAYETAIALADSISARVGLYQVAILTGDRALADQQVSAARGRRDEVDMFGIRIFAAAYRGRMKEASELASEYQARALALSRGQATGNVMMQLAISEALFGLVDQAKARIDQLEEDGILGDNTIDDRLVVAAIAKDAALARELLPAELEQIQKNGEQSSGAERARAVRALAALAEGKPAEAVALLEPVSFDTSHTDAVNIWSIAKMQVGDWPAAAKGLAFLSSRDALGGLSPIAVFAPAMLARVQSQLGQREEALRNYRKCLELLTDADPDLPLLVQLKDELAKLSSS
jgi:tetratricopeptide (TPR) repeat protein